MKTQHPHLICHGRIGNPHLHLDEEVQVQEQPNLNLCEHRGYCSYRKAQRDQHKFVDCVILDGKKYQCRKIKQFYDAYGDYNSQLGIGSRI